ncbi:LysR family transcriptional regulator [Asanoa iriomotensis]|uniref:LysR family transcriptional regulator n=1 Tax=Asanoa iriomotensis TaxID=234613 RepID=A0ABQ4CC04_9ACTN|nr:LysR family transcriptional regulator [Asanoa iriomotensis]
MYFIALAENLHFGRAAERLGIAQPQLSRAIIRLERRMGVRLFDRTSRRVRLTEAGDVFLRESRGALAAVDGAVRRTQQAAQPRRLVLAVRSGTGAGLLPRVLDAYRRGPDPVPVETVFTPELAAAVRDGTADMALICDNEDFDGLDSVALLDEDPVALLPLGHPLAGRDSVTVRELQAEEQFHDQCPPASLDEIVDRVALGQLVVVIGASATGRLGPSVVAVPVADLPGTRLVLAWPRATALATRDRFVRTAIAVAISSGQLPGAAATEPAGPGPAPESAAVPDVRRRDRSPVRSA